MSIPEQNPLLDFGDQSELVTTANFDNVETATFDPHAQGLDNTIENAVNASSIGVLARNKEAIASRLAVAHALYLAMGDDENMAAYVLSHRSVKGRRRLPSKRKPALLALIIAFDPHAADEMQICYGLAYVLTAMKTRGVLANDIANAFMQTTVQHCRKEVRASRGALKFHKTDEAKDSEKPRPSTHHEDMQLPPWNHRSEVPTLYVFRVTSTAAEPLAQLSTSATIDAHTASAIAHKLMSDIVSSAALKSTQHTADDLGVQGNRQTSTKQGSTRRHSFDERYRGFASLERLQQRQPK